MRLSPGIRCQTSVLFLPPTAWGLPWALLSCIVCSPKKGLACCRPTVGDGQGTGAGNPAGRHPRHLRMDGQKGNGKCPADRAAGCHERHLVRPAGQRRIYRHEGSARYVEKHHGVRRSRNRKIPRGHHALHPERRPARGKPGDLRQQSRILRDVFRASAGTGVFCPQLQPAGSGGVGRLELPDGFLPGRQPCTAYRGNHHPQHLLRFRTGGFLVESGKKSPHGADPPCPEHDLSGNEYAAPAGGTQSGRHLPPAGVHLGQRTGRPVPGAARRVIRPCLLTAFSARHPTTSGATS